MLWNRILVSGKEDKKSSYRSDFLLSRLLDREMSLIDRYVLKEWLIAFALTLGVIIGILILQNMYDSLPDLLQTDAGFKQIVLYYSLALPTYLPAILPIALLVSLLFALGTLHRNNEIIAMRASGVSLIHISRSLWVAGLLLSLLLVYLTSSVIPKAVEQSRTFFDNLEFAADETQLGAREIGLLYNLGFDNRKDGRLWFMNRFSERAWLGLGVNVHTRDTSGQELSRISAAEAYFDDTHGHWVFLDGRELLIDHETGDILRALPFEEKKYEDFDEDPSLMLALYKEPKELSINELSRIIDTLPPEENPATHAYLVRFYSLFAAPFSCLVVVGIAVPFALTGVRTNPMVGVSKAMGFFAIFFVLISIASIFGERQIIPAMLAAWIPNLAMLAMSVHLFEKEL